MILKCPDCGSSNKIKKDSKHKCRKCLQYIVVKDMKAIRCIPKELVCHHTVEEVD